MFRTFPSTKKNVGMKLPILNALLDIRTVHATCGVLPPSIYWRTMFHGRGTHSLIYARDFQPDFPLYLFLLLQVRAFYSFCRSFCYLNQARPWLVVRLPSVVSRRPHCNLIRLVHFILAGPFALLSRLLLFCLHLLNSNYRELRYTI